MKTPQQTQQSTYIIEMFTILIGDSEEERGIKFTQFVPGGSCSEITIPPNELEPVIALLVRAKERL